MDPTISVSKGCFVFKNGVTRADKSKKNKKRRKVTTITGVLGTDVTEQPFYKTYKETWNQFQSHIDALQNESYASTLEDLVEYVANESQGNTKNRFGIREILPAAALLTGINQTDHLDQFETLSHRIQNNMSASVSVLQSRDCVSLKTAVESLVFNFIEAENEEEDVEFDRDHKRLRRNQCTMRQLTNWYKEKYANSTEDNEVTLQPENMETNDEIETESTSSKASTHSNNTAKKQHALVVILPDFECFNPSVLQDFILILSTYCANLPLVLVLGVATSVSAIHNSLPYHVTSKIQLRIFQTQSAPVCLNEILEKVILSPNYVFHLSGKTFKFLTHIFLYYDFSINGFIQGFKYCLMEHFFQGNAYAVCTNYSASLAKIKSMTHDDVESIRHLLSFRPYVESINDCKRIISILTDDDYLKKKLPQLLRDCHIHFLLFRIFLEFLTVLVGDLPKSPLGKYRRELYAVALSKELSDQAEFKECWQILGFMSKSEFVAKIVKAINITKDFLEKDLCESELLNDCTTIINEKFKALQELLTKVENAGLTENQTVEEPSQEPHADLKKLTSRHDLKERLMQMSKDGKKSTTQNQFTQSLQAVLTFIQTDIVQCHLAPLQRAPPLHELFVFSDISTVRRNIIGAPRAALHMALNNPHFYLQCKCCHLEQHSKMLPTLPDLSIVYKLHLECGRMINLYDWLQAFCSIVDYKEDVDQMEQVDPQIQARFARAVAELQFLGYIKMSKRKTDHATRLTW